jgi:hypothetical protein
VRFEDQIFREFHMYKPGAYHHARFMGKCIYLLKMFILSPIFPVITAAQLRSLMRLVKFVLAIYGRNFLSTGVPSHTPLNVYNLYYELHSYRSIDNQISRKAVTVFSRHEWYLTEEMVMMALFDSRVSHDLKQMMAVTLLAHDKPNPFPLGKPGEPAFRPVHQLLTTPRQPLSVFIGSNSWLIFDAAAEFLRLTQPQEAEFA